MREDAYIAAALFEHRFWLQVLGDHSRFIFNRLSPGETRRSAVARSFIGVFDQLLAQARAPVSDAELAGLTNQAEAAAREIRTFKLELLREHLAGRVEIGLPPTFINHMLNEVEEYLCLLRYLAAGQAPPPQHPIHYHLLWLPDAAGHAAGIMSDLDMVEKDLLAQSDCFTRQFEELFIKATEINGYLRTGLERFPAFGRFNSQAAAGIIAFKAFLLDLLAMVREKAVLSTLTSLIPDHMDREECYYLIKLSVVTEVARPDCDPTRPRAE